MPDYAVTCKKVRKPISKEHYSDYLSYLSDYGSIGNVNYEKTRGLHIHFILKTENTLDYKVLKPEKHGWSVRAVPIYNLFNWISYIQKDRIQPCLFYKPKLIVKQVP